MPIFSAMVLLAPLSATAAKKKAAKTKKAWEARYDGPVQGSDYLTAMAADGQGNVYVTGASWGGTGVNYDYATAKFSSKGKQVWAARYNGPGSGEDAANALAVDAAGNVYVTGYSLGAAGTYDLATIKYDSAGQQLWLARYNGTGNSYGMAIAVDGSGNVYVAGGSVGSGSHYDYIVIKYSSAGAQLWETRYNGPVNGVDRPVAMALDNAGNVHITGYSEFTTGGEVAFATIKYNTNGQQLWLDHYSYVNVWGHQDSVPKAMAVDAQGNVYVTGYINGGQASFTDLLTIKYSPDGERLWVLQDIPGDWTNEPWGITVDKQGNVLLTGEADVFDSGTLGDFFTIKYGPAGEKIWLRRYDSFYDSDRALAVTCDDQNNVYVTGVADYLSVNNDFVFVTIKYSPSGDAIWGINTAPPYYTSYWPEAMAVNGNGEVFVAGTTHSRTNSYDYFIVKYLQK